MRTAQLPENCKSLTHRIARHMQLSLRVNSKAQSNQAGQNLSVVTKRSLKTAKAPFFWPGGNLGTNEVESGCMPFSRPF